VTRAASLLLALGVFGPPALWFATQQTQGGVVYFRCTAGGAPIGPLLGLTGAAACLLAGWLGWRQRGSETASSSTDFLAQVALGAAVIFALANLAAAAAAWIIPPCAR
jgi:hypothetical protein